jgi:hypothetical protein
VEIWSKEEQIEATLGKRFLGISCYLLCACLYSVCEVVSQV